jgi:hypothetical protein
MLSSLLLVASIVGSTYAQTIAIGAPCTSHLFLLITGVVGVAADVCLNAHVLTLADVNANVVLHCVNGAYASTLCATGRGCQNGQCVSLISGGSPNGTATGGTGPTGTSAPVIAVGVPCTSHYLSL